MFFHVCMYIASNMQRSSLCKAVAQDRKRIEEAVLQYVTVSAKTSHFCTKILINFLVQLIATLNIYPHTISPVARFKWYAFLRGNWKPCTA